jgi:uncharacterized protein YndB with AHSA1/START domain
MTIARSSLPHQLSRTVLIEAEPETVFRYFTDSRRWAIWWGEGSEIDARPGGQVLVRFGGGAEGRGEVTEIDPPRTIAFTFGYSSGSPIPIGSSLVEISLQPRGSATELTLTHFFAETGARDEHVQGWRYQFSVFANVVADEVFARAADTVDQWFAAWTDPQEGTRNASVQQIVAPGIRVRDRFSAIDGVHELLPHLAAVHRFMPGTQLVREGPIRQCQGAVLADWVARTSGGAEQGRGTNVFVLQSDGRIVSVTGFWMSSPRRG